MNLKTDLAASKKMIADGLEDWALGIVDGLTAGNPRLQMAGVYMKNGIRNYRAWKESEIDGYIETAALFIGDSTGEVNAGKVVDDLSKMLTDLDEQPWSMGIIGGTIGKGKISIAVPQNIITRTVFGDCGAISITTEDIKQIKDFIV